MRRKLLVAFAGILIAVILLSAGYAWWEKSLLIKGNITVNVPQENSILPISVLDAVYGETMPVYDAVYSEIAPAFDVPAVIDAVYN